MLRTRTRIAAALDRLALALYETGRRVGGDSGGRLADRVANASIGPARALLAVEDD